MLCIFFSCAWRGSVNYSEKATLFKKNRMRNVEVRPNPRTADRAVVDGPIVVGSNGIRGGGGGGSVCSGEKVHSLWIV